MKITLRFVFAFIAAAALSLAADAAAKNLVIVSIDGLPADYIDNPALNIPTIRKLATEGARAEAVLAVFPTVTWPNHTSMVTGQPPAKHGVLGNSYFDRKKDAEVILLWDPVFDKTEIVKAPTIYDIAHKAGLKTAAVSWPASRNAPTLDWQLPCMVNQTLLNKYTTPSLVSELAAKNIPFQHKGEWASKEVPPAHDEQKPFLSKRGAEGKIEWDRMHTQVASHIIETHKPNLLLLHYDCVDAFEHQTGRNTPDAYSAVEETDRLLKQLIDSVERAGLLTDTAFIITSDHGFHTYTKQININVTLRDAGLITTNGKKITGGSTAFVSMGGAGGIYIKSDDPAQREAITKKLVPILQKIEGIDAVLLPADLKKLGQPTRDENPHAADIMLSAKNGYSFSGSLSRPDVIHSLPSQKGSHGYLPSHPELKAIFIAWGAGIKSGVKTGEISMMDLGPTAAALLNLKFPAPTQGRALTEILK